RYALEGVTEIQVGRGDRRAATVVRDAGGSRMTLELPSPILSRVHARLRRSPAGWALEDAGSRNGTYVNVQRIARADLQPGDLVEIGHAFLTIGRFEERADAPARDLDAADLAGEPAGFRTLSPAVAARLEELRRAARSDVNILLVGESGTGKEVLARGIHHVSGRPGPLVAVNCNTLKEGLTESQLFGHVRGAFSGAVADAVGFVRAADRGTLLLATATSTATTPRSVSSGASWAIRRATRRRSERAARTTSSSGRSTSRTASRAGSSRRSPRQTSWRRRAGRASRGPASRRKGPAGASTSRAPASRRRRR